MEGGFSPEVPQAQNVELKSPYCVALFDKAKKSVSPENAKPLTRVFQEIDKQSIDNFNVFKPSRFPGTEISFIKLSITPDLVKDLSRANTYPKTDEDAKNLDDKNEVAFMFSALAKPPDGNAASSQDMGIDRFMRNLPRVARAIKEGKVPPQVDLFLMGTGTGTGEKVTKDFVDAVQNEGFDAVGQVYAEFIEQYLADKDINNIHLLLQGASMGTGTGDKTFKYLPDAIKKVTQRLFDNPAGEHIPSKLRIGKLFQAARLGFGFIPEFIRRGILPERFGGDRVAKLLDSAKGPFAELLSKQKGLQPDTEEQLELKKGLYNAETAKLFEGFSLDKDERTFIRRGTKDLTTSWGHAARMTRRERQNEAGETRTVKGVSMESVKGTKGETLHRAPEYPQVDKGRTLEAPMKRGHSFIYENFGRWDQILNYCASVPKSA